MALRRMGRAAALLPALLAAGCDWMTDEATRLDFALERATASLPVAEGSRYLFVYEDDARNAACDGGYKVQMFPAGALVVWCLRADGTVAADGLTTHHNNYMDTAREFLLTKPAGAPLRVEFERRRGRPLIVNVR
jgi:hypothetical protein